MYIKRSIGNSGSIYLLLNADDIQIQNNHELRPHTTVPRNRYPTACRQPISLSQPADFNLVLKRFRMEDEQPASTLLNPHLRLDGIAETAPAPRPDIAFAVAALFRYNANPRTGHITTARRVLRYLKAAADYRLYYRKSINGRLIGFTDSDWAGDNADRNSQGGYIFVRNDCNSISW